eukprot:2532021-Pyramimonas_sp.AAC.1
MQVPQSTFCRCVFFLVQRPTPAIIVLVPPRSSSPGWRLPDCAGAGPWAQAPRRYRCPPVA